MQLAAKNQSTWVFLRRKDPHKHERPVSGAFNGYV
jgi:hypothetical protein